MPPVVINIVCLGAVHRTQRNWRGVVAEGPSRGGAGLTDIRGPVDVEVDAPNQLKQRPVLRLRYLPRDAGCIGITHLLAVDRRMLRLFGVGTLQQEPGRAPVPEVAAEECSDKRFVGL